MKFFTVFFLALLSLSTVTLAQIDLLDPELATFGRIATFSETDGRNWSSVDCNNAEVFQIISDPIVGSNLVGLFTSTACTDEGFTLNETFIPFDFSLHAFMSLDVYAPAAGLKIVFKIFNSADPTQAKIVEALTTSAADWDSLNFDFTGTPAGLYDRISIHPDFGGTTAGQEWMFDNIRKDRGGLLYLPNDGLLVDFDTVMPFLHYWDCGTVSPAEFYVTENPSKDDVNPSDLCALMLSSDCAWEGFAIAEKWAPLDFTVYSEARIKVLAPEAGLNFMFKVELWENSGIMVETTVTTEVGNAWEELRIDLSGIEPEKFTKIAFFPDFQSVLIADEWFIDDIRIVDPSNVAVEKKENVIKVFALSAKNYPNPYNPTTTISYNVPLQSNVKVSVFDLNGRELQTLINAEHSIGEHQVQFDASNLSSGVYFYKVETSYDVVVNKMVVMQ